MTEYCCESLEEYENEDHVIYRGIKRIYINTIALGDVIITHCPWCGKKLNEL